MRPFLVEKVWRITEQKTGNGKKSVESVEKQSIDCGSWPKTSSELKR